MTVQSIDKRVVPEANMTPAAQDKTAGAASAEDAFVALLQQTGQRFGNRLANSTSATSVLANHLSRKSAEPRPEKAQPARDDAAQARPAAAKDARPAARADKPRQPQDDGAVARKPDAKDAAPARTTETGEAETAPAAEDAAPADAAAPRDDGTDQQADAQPQPQDAAAAVIQVQAETVVAVDDDEAVLVAATVATAAATTEDDAAEAPVLAEAGKDDRRLAGDSGKKVVTEQDAGDAAALDDAELAGRVVGKADPQQAAATGQATDPDALRRQQTDDLAERLGDAGIRLDVKVQTAKADAATPVGTAAVVESFTQLAAAGPGPDDAGQDFDPSARQQGGQPQGEPVKIAAQAAAATEAAKPAQAADPRAFSAVLAAQVEATVAKPADIAPEQRPVTGLAAVGAAQAADKPAAAHAAQGPRAPRVPLQQQVMEQVNVQIDKAVKDGADTVKIQLKPLDLGKIEIRLEMIDGRVSATVTADKPETLALLQRDAKGLEKALEDAGLKPEANGTSFNLRGGEQQHNADRGHDGQRAGHGRGQGGGFAGDEAGQPASAQAAQPRRANGRTGVDISV